MLNNLENLLKFHSTVKYPFLKNVILITLLNNFSQFHVDDRH